MFNAVSYVKEMREAGFTEKQAEILMQCQIDVMNSHFATREDISELKGELKADIEDLKNKLGGIVVSCTIALGVILKLT